MKPQLQAISEALAKLQQPESLLQLAVITAAVLLGWWAAKFARARITVSPDPENLPDRLRELLYIGAPPALTLVVLATMDGLLHAAGLAASFAAFAGAKHALRALAQSMARELGPLNVHVAHVIIDGAIDTAFIRDNFPAVYARRSDDGILAPDHIADAYWFLHSQPRDAWTFELDLRPWSERW